MKLSRGVISVISVIFLIAVVVVLAATVSVFALQLGEEVSDVGPTTTFHLEYDHLGDSVSKNDTVTITHVAGDVLLRKNLEVVIGDDMVYNETADSETTNDDFEVPGLIVEVNPGDEFNDLQKPCRLDGEPVSPSWSCGGPPGDGDGSDSGVVLHWAENVSAGERIVTQERNHSNSVAVIEPGDTVQIIYQADGFSAVIEQGTVPEE